MAHKYWETSPCTDQAWLSQRMRQSCIDCPLPELKLSEDVYSARISSLCTCPRAEQPVRELHTAGHFCAHISTHTFESDREWTRVLRVLDYKQNQER